MHFNDLLMRLRSQGLAGIAAVATLVGVFAKDGGPGSRTDWGAATPILFALGFFWIAIFCLDILYYNKLLGGSIIAITKLEKSTKSETSNVAEINMSTIIEAEFKKSDGQHRSICDQFKSIFSKSSRSQFGGVYLFYGIVFSVIAIGIVYSWHMSAISP
jgi:Na+/melibiose symporter-like transporter